MINITLSVIFIIAFIFSGYIALKIIKYEKKIMFITITTVSHVLLIILTIYFFNYPYIRSLNTIWDIITFVFEILKVIILTYFTSCGISILIIDLLDKNEKTFVYISSFIAGASLIIVINITFSCCPNGSICGPFFVETTSYSLYKETQSEVNPKNKVFYEYFKSDDSIKLLYVGAEKYRPNEYATDDFFLSDINNYDEIYYITDTEDKRETLTVYNSEIQRSFFPDFNKEPIVFITLKGNKYHRRNCKSIKKSDNIIQTNLYKVLDFGYEPCLKCNPPKVQHKQTIPKPKNLTKSLRQLIEEEKKLINKYSEENKKIK